MVETGFAIAMKGNCCMATTARRKRDNRSEQTRTALIEAAEALFARDGFDRVSTRQIGTAIGSANNTVVAYHFGSKEALIEAIYRHRLPQIEARRGELRREAETAGGATQIRPLFAALWQPLFEAVDTEGRHAYAMFLQAMLRDGMLRSPRLVIADIGETMSLVDLITEQLPFETGPRWDMRWQLATGLVLDAIAHIDSRYRDDRQAAEGFFAEAIDMAIAALLAPLAGD